MVKALQYKTFGKPDVLQLVDLPLVHPKADEVSIKVSHVGLNPMDWAILWEILKFRLSKFWCQTSSNFCL